MLKNHKRGPKYCEINLKIVRKNNVLKILSDSSACRVLQIWEKTQNSALFSAWHAPALSTEKELRQFDPAHQRLYSLHTSSRLF